MHASNTGDGVAGLPLCWHGLPLELRPEGALLLPGVSALLIADFHLGKAHSFRRLGVPVPGGTTADLLLRLDDLLARVRPQQLVFLGDFLHAATAQASPALRHFAEWRGRHADLRLTLVRGNHDDRAGDPPSALDMGVVDEPWALGGLQLCHHPLPLETPAPQSTGAPRVAGHWHPAAVLQGRARDRVRLPCFCLSPSQLVLPAFGGFTGMHTVPAQPGLQRFITDGQRVRELA